MKIERYESSPRMSQAVAIGSLVFLSGQVANDAAGTIERQTAEVLANVARLLELVGSDRTRILSASVYLTDASHFNTFNRAWEQWLESAHTPARTTVVTQLAAPGYLIEIHAIAARASEW